MKFQIKFDVDTKQCPAYEKFYIANKPARNFGFCVPYF